MSSDLVVQPQEFRDVTVIASNAEQMAVAQKTLIARADSRMSVLKGEIRDLKKNLELADKNKLRKSGIQAAIYKAQRRITFYGKLRDAFEAGYTLIPDMDIEVFAVRTTRAKPTGDVSEESKNYEPTASTPDQKADLAVSGEGRYVEPRATEIHERGEYQDSKGQTVKWDQAIAAEFVEEVGFPFALAKPKIVEMTGQAMALKIFDEVGVLPNTRRADPMVIGRIVLREGYQTRNMNFLICWFVDTATI